MLQRNIDVLDERIVCGDGVEEFLGDPVGVGVEKTHPLLRWSLDRGEAGQELRETVFDAEVLAEAGGVLADEIEFADALGEESRGFCNDRLEATAAEGSAILRDDAEGTGMIAAFGDFEVGEVVRRREDARREVVIQVGDNGSCHVLCVFAHRDDLFDLVGADHGVDFGKLLLDIVAVAFNEATGDDKLARPPGLLVLRHLDDGVDGFLFGRVDEAAGIDDQNVGITRIGGEFVTTGR